MLPWLERPLEQARRALRAVQAPHGWLIHGSRGTGRGALAAQIAAEVLSIDAPTVAEPWAAPRLAHPDLHGEEPPPDKLMIGVDQIRRAAEFASLTSHAGHGKVILIEPAEAMTHAAANALLKTLEEPPPGTLLILTAESPGLLPATVVSRCVRLAIAMPRHGDALNWLRSVDQTPEWPTLLEHAGGAPLAALELHQAGKTETLAAYADDLAQLIDGRHSPAGVARRWAGDDVSLAATWLYRRAAADIRRGVESSAGVSSESGTARLQTADKTLTMQRRIDLLSEVNDLRRLVGKGINAELQLANVLTHWDGA